MISRIERYYRWKLEQRFWKYVDKSGECWIWTGATFNEGDGAFGWNKKVWRAHRVAWILTHGEIPQGMLLCHHCDTPQCVRPAHMFLGTHYDNMEDMFQKGRDARPRRQWRMSAVDHQEIRDRYAAGGLTQLQLAYEYGVSERQIRYILKKAA